jgi:hypothetical protein
MRRAQPDRVLEPNDVRVNEYFAACGFNEALEHFRKSINRRLSEPFV